MDDDVFNLLEQFVRKGSQEAFRLLMERYAGMVYAACLRMLDGNETEAKDAMQAVFIILARKSRHISRQVALGGWLYRTAQMVISNMKRETARRRKREAEAMREAELINKDDHSILWSEIRPCLDAGIAGLGKKQQNAIICRFLEEQSIRETALSIGCSEETAKKRIMYGLKNLREFLSRRKVAISTTVLVELLHAEATKAVSAELIKTCLASTMGSLSGGAGVLAGPEFIANGVLTLMKIKTMTAVGLAAVAVIGAVLIAPSVVKKVMEPQHTVTDSTVLNTGLIGTNAQHYTNSAISPLKVVRPDELNPPVNTRQQTAAKGQSSINWEEQLRQALVIKDQMERFGALGTLASKVAREDINEGLRLIDKISGREDRSWYIRSLFISWSQMCPQAAVAGISKCRDDDQITATSGTASGWSMKDASAAIQWSCQLPEGKVRNSALIQIAWPWADKDPSAAADGVWRLMQGEGLALNDAVSRVLEKWVKKDAAAAIRWTLQLPEGEAREWALNSVAGGWAKNEPEAAANWVVQQLPEGESRDRALSKVVEALVTKDPEATAQWALQLPETKDRKLALSKAVGKLADKDPATAGQLILQMQEMNLIDPYLNTNSPYTGFSLYDAIDNTAKQWARKDATAAAQWALQLSSEYLRNKALRCVASAWAEKDPAAAAQLALQIPEMNYYYIDENGNSRQPTEEEILINKKTSARNMALSNVVEEWAKKDPAAAVDWAEQLPAEISETAFNAIVKSQVAAMIEEGANFEETLSSIAELPVNLQDAALGQLVVTWMKKDDPSAQMELAGWIKRQPAGPLKDHIIDRYCSCMKSDQDQQFGMELAGQIENKEDRASQIQQVFISWASWDPKSAHQWLEKSSLSDDVKSDLLKILKQQERK